MLQSEVLICKLVAVDGLSTGSIVIREIPTLAHEPWDDTVEARTLVAKTLLSGAQGSEVLSSLGDHISSQLRRNKKEELTGCTGFVN